VIPTQGPTAPEPTSDLATRLAAAASRAQGVVRLSGGTLGGVATYAAGRRVEGVRVRADHVEIHVVVSASVPSVLAVAEAVRRSATAVDSSRRIDVFIDDIDPEVIDLDAVELAGTMEP
jgi:hypothetical protein